MAQIAIQRADVDGLDATYTAAAAGGDTVAPSGRRRLLLHVRNTDTAAHSVTIDDPHTQGPEGAAAFDPDVTVSVPAGDERFVLLSPLARFVDANGNVNLTYSAATGMQVAALDVG